MKPIEILKAQTARQVHCWSAGTRETYLKLRLARFKTMAEEIAAEDPAKRANALKALRSVETTEKMLEVFPLSADATKTAQAYGNTLVRHRNASRTPVHYDLFDFLMQTLRLALAERVEITVERLDGAYSRLAGRVGMRRDLGVSMDTEPKAGPNADAYTAGYYSIWPQALMDAETAIKYGEANG